MHLLLTQDPCRDAFFGLPANGFLYQWLDGLLRARFEDAGWQVSLAAPHEAGGTFDPRPLAAALDLPATPLGWARLFDLDHAGPARLAAFEAAVDAQLGGAELIVGFELPPWLMQWATRRGIAFACLAPAGYRFLPELLVELHTDIPALAQWARQRAVERDALENAAALFAAGRRARHRVPLLTEGRIGVLAGQMGVDAANIAGGRPTTLDRRIAAIAAIAADLDTLLVCPHPYEPDRAPLHAVCAAIGNARLTSLPTYDLLCAPPVREVIALSSSLLTEAPLFGKRAHALITSDRTACRAALGLRPVVLAIDDLLDCLGGLARQGEPVQTSRRLPGTGTPFRDGLGLSWGLGEVELPPLLRPGAPIDAALGAAGLPAASRLRGWWPADAAFSWTAATEARLLLRANGCAGRRLEVRLYAPPHADGPVTAGLTAGTRTSRTAIPPGEMRTLALDLAPDALIGGTLLDLALTADRLTPPADDGADPRALGIGLHGLAVD